ncbi:MULTISPECIES: pantoate--beta-alanine ligase [Metallibacterium]|jgi:pantoate--beta-alanine ligase|uniref:pantoate--beta-alanine ligase n=1 Tax=Metallibacterium TaxID=1218803 RepID=UPI00260E82CD|nr:MULTISPECIES: pantoate--beta-alanine ligase [Metallibacterium]MBW8074479.1 pantoate--beta-alanine ligase [Metallibacterium scheffleri]
MQTVHDLAGLRAVSRAWRRQGQRVALVPTMGNLHAGHFALVRRAQQCAPRVVASVFVNPTQFGPGEDYARYPRTLEQDQAGLAALDCDLLFAPTVEVMYPYGIEHTLRVQVPQITEVLEGAHRPGHFDGVATVVAKLFAMVQPDYAVFGEKDWQQLQVVRRLVRDLGLPLEIVGLPTVREADGLALSSRNQYLDAGQRARAPLIHATLRWMREIAAQGHVHAAIERAAAARLQRAGLVPDYCAIRVADSLLPADDAAHARLIALIAARLGRTRLIDNLPFTAA